MKRIITFIMIAITLLSYNPQITPAETTNQTDPQSSLETLNSPKNFKGSSSKGIIKLKWRKNTAVGGYYLYKNGKKIKTLKKTKSSYKDKKTRLNKTYKYRIQSYKKINGEIIKSKKSYTVRVKSTNSKSKTINAARVTNVKRTYKIGPGESIKIKPIIKYSKKIKGKKAKKKKVFSKKVFYKTSNSKLVSVNKKGVLKATSEKQYESATITIRTHNGVTKKIKVNVVNFAQIGSVKNIDQVRCDVTKRILTTSKSDTSKIAEYFQSYPTKKKTTIKDGYRKVDTEDGGVTHEDCLEISDDIYIEENMYNYILKYILNNFGTEIVVDNNYVYFRYKKYYSYGIEVHDLVYVFDNHDALEHYQYMNAIYNVTSVADRWYYGKGMAYGSIG